MSESEYDFSLSRDRRSRVIGSHKECSEKKHLLTRSQRIASPYRKSLNSAKQLKSFSASADRVKAVAVVRRADKLLSKPFLVTHLRAETGSFAERDKFYAADRPAFVESDEQITRTKVFGAKEDRQK